MNDAASLALYANTSLPDALTVTQSQARAFFKSNAFTDWKKSKESEGKAQVAVVNRLNSVIKAINNLMKSRF